MGLDNKTIAEATQLTIKEINQLKQLTRKEKKYQPTN